MKKFALVALTAVLAVGCVDAGIPTPHSGVGRQGWWITEPNSQGDRYECFYWSLNESTAVWCPDTPYTP